MISGGRAASISERESSLAFLKMTHYSTQPLRPHRRGRQGHPSMLPATKRWGRRLEGPLAEVARTASAFLARSAEGEAPSYGSNAAALSLYSQQRWRRVLTRVLVPTCFASTCCHGASAPRAMIQSPPPALFLAMFMADSDQNTLPVFTLSIASPSVVAGSARAEFPLSSSPHSRLGGGGQEQAAPWISSSA